MEASIALLILSIVLLTIVPAWILLQEKLESSHQKAVSLVAAHNEVEKFMHYLEDKEAHSVEIDGYSYQITWLISRQGDLEEGRLHISWVSSSRKRESLHYQLHRLKKDSQIMKMVTR